MPRLVHLQILRAVAASLVVIDHSFTSLAFRKYAVSQYILPGDLLGHAGVCAFFVLSGFIMVRQSAASFGVPYSPVVFLWHRILRIVPLYWIATLLWLFSRMIWHVETPHTRFQLMLSLAFLPNVVDPIHLMHPILEQGWTLNYEMAFYLLFALCLFLPRRLGITALLATLSVLVWLGRQVPQTAVFSLWSFYTDWLLLLFAGGVLIGYLELKINRVTRFQLSTSPAFLLAVPPVFVLLRPHAADWHDLWKPMGVFSAAVVILCTVTNLDRPGWINRILILLGDASYSTYLFHLWAIWLCFGPATRAYALFHSTLDHPAFFVAAAVLAANLLGLAIHLAFERPLTRGLRNLTRGPFKYLNAKTS